jgi:serine protease Do
MKNKILLTLSLFLFIASVHAQEGGIQNLRETSKAFASVARTVSPSVVYIRSEGNANEQPMTNSQSPFGEDGPFNEELLKRFFGNQFQLPKTPRPERPNNMHRTIGQGSGFVFESKDGLFTDKSYILTNNHVVAGAEKIYVHLQDGRQFDAEIVGSDPQSDVTVLMIKAGGLPALPLGNSSSLEVGEWVIAIGSPFGLSHSLTVGVVSAKGRTSLGISDYEDFIQTDAAINPGNSGGPLVNLDGEVIGINTAIFSRSGGYMGIGFAIPVDLAAGIANQLMDNGEVVRGYLGILIQDLTPELAKSFDLETNQGILIAQVTEGSPSEKAGLKQGDVIISFQGNPVTKVGRFRNHVSLTSPGSKQQLTIIRDGKRRDISITIGTLSKDQVIASATTQSTDVLGLTVQTLTPQLAEQFNTKAGTGVVITQVRPGSIAADVGIHAGSIIVQVNRIPISTAEDFTREVKKSSDNKRILLLLRNGNTQHFVALNW